MPLSSHNAKHQPRSCIVAHVSGRQSVASRA